jgi:hypothetical protein
MTPHGRRVAVFLALCAAGVALLAAYIELVYRPRLAASAPVSEAGVTDDLADLAAYNRGAHVVFVNASLDQYNDRLAVQALDGETGPRFIGSLRCERVHVGGKVGLCLTADRGVLTRYYGYLFDEKFHSRSEFPLQGTPSRVRVSPDGSLGAITVFVAGDSYTNNSFSTRTTILDTATAQPLGELEQFTAIRDGQPFRAVDFNYWGVTFAREPGVFYATLATGKHMYLVRGSVPRREVTVVYDGVECPSLSPDGTRVVFKKRVTENGRLGWRLHVLDLHTLTAVPVAETRSVDDQAEWLDRDRVLYALPRDEGGMALWSVPADGSGAPVTFLDNAYSPAVARP